MNETQITFTEQEINTLANALDALARSSQDILLAAKQLIPIRDKLNEAVKQWHNPPQAQ